MNIYTLLALIAGLSLGAVVAYRLGRERSAGPAPQRPSARPGIRPESLMDVLEHMSVGVVVLDPSLHPQLANVSARELLGLQADELPAHLPSPPVTEVARSAQEAGGTRSELVDISFPARRTLHVQATSLPRLDRVMVVLQDVSEEVRVQKVRREFVAHASHELKSPVASVQALTEAVLQAMGDDPAEAERFGEQLLGETERLGKLVTDLLDLSRLEEPGDPPSDPCDLEAVAKREADQAERGAAERGLTLSRSLEPGLTMIGDAGQLALLLRNLLDNAIQYTPVGGKVNLEARRAGDSVIVRVEDTGIGIPLEAQPRIFERFYRVDRARSRARGGTGLGLAIVKHVAELHGGRIDLQSEVGRGSTFEIVFPDKQEVQTEKESA